MNQNLLTEMYNKGAQAKKAARKLAVISSEVKDKALVAMAKQLEFQSAKIEAANELDLIAGREKGLSKALLDRLMLNSKRITEMADGLRALANLDDPVGEVLSMWKRPNGLQVGRIRVPLGVVGIIYEARPNVTVDAAGLCLKTGNSVILRGGSEAINSNKIITEIISTAAVEAGMPESAIQLIDTTDREAVNIMLKMNKYLDVLIPRGGAGLIQAVVENATVPVIETGIGNCHIYVDTDADLEMANKIVINAKCQRPGVCNAAESLVVHQDIAADFLPQVAKLLQQQGVELRGCADTKGILPQVKLATEEDFGAEFLDLIISVKVVGNIDEAIEHIHQYGTGHSEAIITENYSSAQKFLKLVDAAAVYVNASTRFTDGFQFGFGAEIGISTQKLHARGPMGLKEMTTTKFIIFGEGQIRS
ncbi:MAG: glutamate-5-semialdehyde dehydrogenase [Bacillota bacterium]|nr:glutamate-5-semialdehyde dehydrogenase [Bacillota bacterium]